MAPEEKKAPEASKEQATKPSIDDIVSNALSDKKLSASERENITNKYKEYLEGKATIKDETKQELKSFLKSANGGTKFEKFKKDMLAKLDKNPDIKPEVPKAPEKEGKWVDEEITLPDGFDVKTGAIVEYNGQVCTIKKIEGEGDDVRKITLEIGKDKRIIVLEKDEEFEKIKPFDSEKADAEAKAKADKAKADAEAKAKADKAKADAEAKKPANIQKNIDEINKITSDGKISLKEEGQLLKIIDGLQKNNVIEGIPGIKDGKFEGITDDTDLVERKDKIKGICDNVVDRLKDIKDYIETKDKNKAEQTRKSSEQTKETQEKTLAKEKSDFLKGLNGVKIEGLDVNKMIDDKIAEYEKSLNGNPEKEMKAKKIIEKLNGLKIKEGSTKFEDYTTNAEIVGYDENINSFKIKKQKLTFNIDPNGTFDSFDSSTPYEVSLKSLKLEDNKQAIQDKLKSAYSEQVSKLTQKIITGK